MESEDALIRRLGELFNSSFQSGVKVGIGDDAAVFSGTDSDFIATVDMAVEGIHFKRDWSSPFQIGAKLTTASLADVFAMGGEPNYLLVAAGINQNENTQVITEIAEGIRSVADKFKVSVIGGDLSKSEKLVLSITAIGHINSKPIKRDGAKVGDIVYGELISKADDFKDLAELSTELSEDTFDWILNGGEDHFFIATVDPKYRSKDLGIEIGIVEAGDGEVRLDAKEVEIKGYQHF